MKKYILLFLLFRVKEVISHLFIDLKNNYISEGIVVFHGKFMGGGKYKMMYGKDKPLNQVFFDKRVIYPDRTAEEYDYIAIIETFDTGFKKFLLVHSFRYKDNKYNNYRRKYYKYGISTINEITKKKFMSKLKYEIEISIDKMHPFIIKTVDNYTFRKEKYSIKDEFNGIKLDKSDAPKYTFGYVYDSSKNIMTGYTKVNWFVRVCDYFEIERRMFGDQIKLTNGKVVVQYDIVYLMDKPVWSANITSSTIAYDEYQGNAIKVMDKIDNCSEEFKVVTLDISENISPELFGIEKVTGYVGNGRYTMYQLKKEYIGKERIVYVIDTEAKKMAILNIKSAMLTYVEVFKNFQRTVVIITSLIYDRGRYFKQVDVFNRLVSNFVYYNKLEEFYKNETIDTLVNLFPVKLTIIIDEPPISIYDIVEIKDPKGECYEYKIKEKDERGIDFRKKYTFGNVWVKNPYEKGNIPMDSHKNKYIQIYSKMRKGEFRVLKLKNDDDIIANDGRIYVIT